MDLVVHGGAVPTFLLKRLLAATGASAVGKLGRGDRALTTDRQPLTSNFRPPASDRDAQPRTISTAACAEMPSPRPT